MNVRESVLRLKPEAVAKELHAAVPDKARRLHRNIEAVYLCRFPAGSALWSTLLRNAAPSTFEKVHVRFIHDAELLHRLSQVGGFGKGLRAVEILCLEKKDDLVRVASDLKNVLLG